jgi:hypothetical protein
MGLFGYPHIRDTIQKLRARAATKDKSGGINELYTDRLNVLMRSYKEVPLWWYLALFASSFITIIVILAKGYFFIPGKHLF